MQKKLFILLIGVIVMSICGCTQQVELPADNDFPTDDVDSAHDIKPEKVLQCDSPHDSRECCLAYGGKERGPVCVEFNVEESKKEGLAALKKIVINESDCDNSTEGYYGYYGSCCVDMGYVFNAGDGFCYKASGVKNPVNHFPGMNLVEDSQGNVTNDENPDEGENKEVPEMNASSREETGQNESVNSTI